MQDSKSDIQEQPTAGPDLPIAELGLRTRARNVLLDGGIDTVGDALTALEAGDESLTNLKGFGPKSLADLKKKLRERGFFQASDPSWAEVDRIHKVAPALEEEAALAASIFEEEVAPEVSPPEAEPVAPAATEKQRPEDETTATKRPLDESPSFLQRLQATIAHFRQQPGSGAWAYGAIALLVIGALCFLPPFSFLRRLGLIGYTSVNAQNSSISHSDGLTLSVDPEAFESKLRVRLDSTPRNVLLMGDAGSALKEAISVLPKHLEVKSPLYHIQARGNPAQPVTIDVVIPNNAEPWETLDLYTWTGEAWEWAGSEIHTETTGKEHISAHVTDIPANLVVVQAGIFTSTVATSLKTGDDLTAAVGGAFDELNPTGLLLGRDGNFIGELKGLLQPAEDAPYTVMPLLRNWTPEAPINQNLLSTLLKTPETRDTHIANIVDLCVERGFAGVVLDYRGVMLNEREAYSDFIAALSEAMHAENLRLAVVVESPSPTDGGWETGGYDWPAIAAAADAIEAPFPDDPAAYVENDEARRLLDWATAQAPRYKLRMLVSSLSAEQSSTKIDHISLSQALAPLGEIAAFNDVTQVESGSELSFGFSGQLKSIMPYEAAGTYRLEYDAGAGKTHTVWLGTAASLAAKLRWAQRYHLGGVALTDALSPGNAPGIVNAVANYHTSAAPPQGTGMDVSWTVASTETTVDQQVSPLTDPDYTWTVVAAGGTYTVNATVAGFNHGAVTVHVGQPTAAVTEAITAEAAPTETISSTLVTTELTNECFDASYVADVTISDNEQLDNEEKFVKTWRVRNSGTCDWPDDTVLAFVSDSQMGAPDAVPVGAVESGAETDISVDMEAPAEAGKYTGKWQMQTTEGLFGSQLWVVIQAGEVAASPAPAPISGGSFELGGHVRDTGLPYAEKMHYAGMNWTKVQVHYGQDAAGIIAVAHSNGFKVQLSALGTPGMVTQPGFEQDFANWVAGLAAAGADAIEVWNEPNIEREWQIGHISPQAYTQLLCASYNTIKAANAGTAVISAAPAPTGFFGGCGPNGCDDAPWLSGMRDAGAAQCMDYIGAHHNSGATSPSARIGHPANPGDTHHSWFFMPQTELYYNTFGGTRKLFYTEMGYASQEGVPPFSDAFGWARGTDNSEQAAWLAEAVRLSVSTGMVRCIIVWNIDFIRYGADPQDGFAIIRPGGGCPACESLHNVLGRR